MSQKSLLFASREPAMRSYAASCIDIACKPLVINQSWLYDRHLNTAMMKEGWQNIRQQHYMQQCRCLLGRESATGHIRKGIIEDHFAGEKISSGV